MDNHLPDDARIRPATPDDATAIVDIYNHFIRHTAVTFEVVELSEADMRQRIAHIASGFPYLVCEAGGQLAGYSYAHPWKEREAYRRTLETTVYVAPAMQGHGIGHALMLQLIDDCRRRGFGVLIACITADNTGSCRFHERLGFRRMSHFQDVGEKFGRLWSVEDFQLDIDR